MQGSVHGLLLAAEDGSQLNWEPARDAQLEGRAGNVEGLPLLDVCVLGHSPFDNANADSAFAMNNEWLCDYISLAERQVKEESYLPMRGWATPSWVYLMY